MFRAAVLGPKDVPVITDGHEAAAHLELAVLSVMMHGRERAVVEAFMEGLEFVSPDHAPEYYEYAYSMAASAVRRVLEVLMSSATWPVYSPFAREHFGRGKQEGRQEGEAEALLRVLAARGIEVPDDARARICGCTDLRQLDTWLDRAATATSITDSSDRPPGPAHRRRLGVRTDRPGRPAPPVSGRVCPLTAPAKRARSNPAAPS